MCFCASNIVAPCPCLPVVLRESSDSPSSGSVLSQSPVIHLFIPSDPVVCSSAHFYTQDWDDFCNLVAGLLASRSLFILYCCCRRAFYVSDYVPSVLNWRALHDPQQRTQSLEHNMWLPYFACLLILFSRYILRCLPYASRLLLVMHHPWKNWESNAQVCFSFLWFRWMTSAKKGSSHLCTCFILLLACELLEDKVCMVITTVFRGICM